MLKVSVITMTYNDCENLRKCVERIAAQDYEAMEYIIVDGGSEDGTMDVIEYAHLLLGDRLKWISEPDHGLYDALNKGIRMADGDVIGIMCDEFAGDHVVSLIARTIERTGCDGVHGDIDYRSGDRVIRKWRMGDGSIRTGWMPGHPTLYLRKEVYETYGLYRTDFKIAADYEFMIRILKDGQVSLSYINEVLVYMFHGENSTSTGGLTNYLESFREGLRALKQNHVPFAFWINCLRTGRVLWQFVKGSCDSRTM